MAVNKDYTPLPPQSFAPVKVTVGDWFDLSAGDRHDVLSHRVFRDQVVNVNSVGGRPEADIRLNIQTRRQTDRGEVTETQRFDAGALGTFDEPTDSGPLATEDLSVRVDNLGNADYTQASANDPYQFFFNYTVRPLTVLEKVRNNIPLNDTDRRLAEKYNIIQRERVNLPPETDPAAMPNLEEKRVVTKGSEVTTVDLSSTGRSNGATVLSEAVPNDEVVYVTGIQVSGDEFTPGDDLRLGFARANDADFYRLSTYGVPGAPYEMDVHIPSVDDLTVTAFAGNIINNVDVRIEFARVQRTIVEKALYGLESELISNDDLGRFRADAYAEIRDRLRTGVPINENAMAAEVGADVSTPTQASQPGSITRGR